MSSTDPVLPVLCLRDIEVWVQKFASIENPRVEAVKLLLKEWVSGTTDTSQAIIRIRALIPHELVEMLVMIIKNAEDISVHPFETVLNLPSPKPAAARTLFPETALGSTKSPKMSPNTHLEPKPDPFQSTPSPTFRDLIEKNTGTDSSAVSHLHSRTDANASNRPRKRRKLQSDSYASNTPTRKSPRSRQIQSHLSPIKLEDQEMETQLDLLSFDDGSSYSASYVENAETESDSDSSPDVTLSQQQSPPLTPKSKKRKRSSRKSAPFYFASPRRPQNAWSQEESDRLLELKTKTAVEADWREISKLLGTGKSATQCAQRWSRVVDPDLCKEPFTAADEEEQILKLHSEHGNKWALIAKLLPKRRSDVACRMQVVKLLKSLENPWSQSQDEELVSIMISNREFDWNAVSEQFLLSGQRSPFECKKRFAQLKGAVR